MSKLLLDNYEKIGKSNGIILVKGSIKIVFDIGICTSQGILYCMYFTHDAEVGGASLGKIITYPIHITHARLQNNWDGKLQEVHCMVGKSKTEESTQNHKE